MEMYYNIYYLTPQMSDETLSQCKNSVEELQIYVEKYKSNSIVIVLCCYSVW